MKDIKQHVLDHFKGQGYGEDEINDSLDELTYESSEHRKGKEIHSEHRWYNLMLYTAEVNGRFIQFIRVECTGDNCDYEDDPIFWEVEPYQETVTKYRKIDLQSQPRIMGKAETESIKADFAAATNDEERVRVCMKWGDKIILNLDNDDAFACIAGDESTDVWIGQFDDYFGWTDNVVMLFKMLGVNAVPV